VRILATEMTSSCCHEHLTSLIVALLSGSTCSMCLTRVTAFLFK